MTNTEKRIQYLKEGRTAWPGGYPRYIVIEDGEALCFDCLKNEQASIEGVDEAPARDWTIAGCDVNEEDNDLFCAHCGARIESAYGN